MRPAGAAAASTIVLLVVYLVTLAPDVTFWDAGELIAAVESLGIPHPPGTPLWVLAARAWSDVLAFLPRPLATNLLSAVSVAAAGGVLAWLMVRWTGRGVWGLAAAIAAGTMSTVWLNATETETYALAILLSALMLLAGDRAGVTGETHWMALTAYLFALAVPLHLSALVAAPAAVVLAGRSGEGPFRWRRSALLAAVALGAAAVGTVSPAMLIAAAMALIAAVLLTGPPRRAVVVVGAAVLGLTALLFLPIRASFDPWLNSQNPADWTAFWDLVGRRQYGEHALWPRRAPVWAQLGMIAQYADWQVALGVTPGIVPSFARVLASTTFVALGVLGSITHRRLHRRSWAAVLVLLLSGTIGIAAWMNFQSGPTFGHGLLPEGAGYEARERDYFFILGFWSWGAWAGIGAVRLVELIVPRAGWLGVALAALPLALNWRAVDRNREPEASLPLVVASALLETAPPGGVLITGGDNDTYPAWYAQAVRGSAPDAVVIVSPMLNARWYRQELARRHGLLPDTGDVRSGPYGPEIAALRALADEARRQGRALAVASTVSRMKREAIGGEWTLTGVWYVRDVPGHVGVPALGARADTVALAAFASSVPAPGRASLLDSTDPTFRLMATWLDCPRQVLGLVRGAVAGNSLASVCNL